MNTLDSAFNIGTKLTSETCRTLGTRNFQPNWNGVGFDSKLGKIGLIVLNKKLCKIELENRSIATIYISRINDALIALYEDNLFPCGCIEECFCSGDPNDYGDS